MTGAAFTILSVQTATVLYLTALVFLLSAATLRVRRFARIAWTAGCLFYLAHVYGAFQYFHGWSHAAAYAETARQTAEVFGVNWGGGLYFNYLFTIVWVTDVAWWWLRARQYEVRPRWIGAAVHLFLAFMFFNGTVVFAAGFSRWMGAAATPALLLLWWRSQNRTGERV